MKIIYLSQFYYPEPHSIHKELAEALVNFGHEVVVVTSYPNYPTGRIYAGWKQQIFGEYERVNGVLILRCPVWPSHSKSVLLRGLHFLSFTISSMILIALRGLRADAYLVHHPPPSLAFIAWLYNRKRGCPYIFRMADLWPEFISGADVSENKVLMKIIESFMKHIYKTSSHIIVPSPGFKRILVEKGVLKNKISVIHNYADESVYYPMDEDRLFKKQLSIKTSDVIILYAGNIGDPQRIDILIEAMKLITHHENIKLFIIGEGSCKKSLEEKCSNEGIKSVVFFKQMLPDEVNRYYSIADALFIQLENKPIWTDTIPSKIYAYMLAGRPIIAALRGDGADIVNESKGGIVCDPCDVNAIAQCVLSISDMSSEDRMTMGQNNYDYAIKKFSKSVLIKKIENLLISSIDLNKKK